MLTADCVQSSLDSCTELSATLQAALIMDEINAARIEGEANEFGGTSQVVLAGEGKLPLILVYSSPGCAEGLLIHTSFFDNHREISILAHKNERSGFPGASLVVVEDQPTALSTRTYA